MTSTSIALPHNEIIPGHGHPLVVLPGWGQTIEQTRNLGKLLAPHCKVHLIDLPGFGKSPAPNAVWSAFDYADCLLAYLDRQGLASVDLLGHSFGGKVAMCMAIRYPHRVRKLALLAASGLKPRKSLSQRVRSRVISLVGKSLKYCDRLLATQLFAQQFAPRFASADYKRATGVMRSILVRTVNEDLSAYVGRIHVPTYLLWGEKDEDTPLEMAMRLHRAIPNSQLKVLGQKGHQLIHDAGTHLCAYHLLPFLSEDWADLNIRGEK